MIFIYNIYYITMHQMSNFFQIDLVVVLYPNNFPVNFFFNPTSFRPITMKD